MALIRLGNKPPLRVAAEITATAAAIAMVERKVGAAAVENDGRVVGIITERDILQKVVGAQRDPAATRVSEIMSSPALTIGIKTTVADAAAMMRKHWFSGRPDFTPRTMTSIASASWLPNFF